MNMSFFNYTFPLLHHCTAKNYHQPQYKILQLILDHMNDNAH